MQVFFISGSKIIHSNNRYNNIRTICWIFLWSKNITYFLLQLEDNYIYMLLLSFFCKSDSQLVSVFKLHYATCIDIKKKKSLCVYSMTSWLPTYWVLTLKIYKSFNYLFRMAFFHLLLLALFLCNSIKLFRLGGPNKHFR